MTLRTWKDEFYPVPADDPSIETDLQAIEHSLRKWEGLRYDNRAKHEISAQDYMGRNYIEGEDSLGITLESLNIDTSSCALCEKFYSTEGICGNCPLYKEREGHRCDEWNSDGGNNPYISWTSDVNPEPMIELLKAALETEKRK